MIDSKNIPKHIAIILVGNGRWAKKRGLPRTAGHHVGIKRVKEIVKAADELGVKFLTFFAFSSENWKRPKAEVNMLMHSLNHFLKQQVKEMVKNNIRFVAIGREDILPAYLKKEINESKNKTKDNTGLTVVLALNYGSRQEIVDAAKKFTVSVVDGKAELNDLDVEKFSQYLYTADLPDPDLLIRTSGEMRVSNFLLWQISYSELHFPKKCWPDFRKQDLEEAIEDYQKRERRFGGLCE